jgi:choline kinase
MASFSGRGLRQRATVPRQRRSYRQPPGATAAANYAANRPFQAEIGPRNVKAIILSAGQGKRLLPLTERAPKCMLPVAGHPLVARQIDALLGCGVEDITVVVGFGAELVETGLAQRYGARRIRTLYNPFYTITDNLVSCWVARGEMEREFLILNGDTLFASIVLERLLAAPLHPISLAVSRKDAYDDDDMKVIRDGDRLLRVGKKLGAEVNAESIGMMTFRGEGPRLFRDAMDAALRSPAALSQWYLSLIDALAKTGVVYTQEVPAAGWAEVDSPADLERASTPGAAWLNPA